MIIVVCFIIIGLSQRTLGINSTVLTSIYDMAIVNMTTFPHQQYILNALGNGTVKGLYGDLGPNASVETWRSTTDAWRSTAPDTLVASYFVHGANYARGSTLFPHSIGLAASFNSDLVESIGIVTAAEARYCGVNVVFGPSLDVGTNPSWAGLVETFGEDPFTVSVLGASMIKGLQAAPKASYGLPSTVQNTVAAIARHFVLTGAPRSGYDGAPSWLAPSDLLQYYASPFRNTAALGVMTANMDNFGRPSLMSAVCDTVLRTYLSYDGAIFTSDDEVTQLWTHHKAVKSFTNAVFQSVISSSYDMALLSFSSGQMFPSTLRTLVMEFQTPQSRVTNSSQRIQQLRNLVVPRASIVNGTNTSCMFGCQESQALSLQAARESIVLLRNEGNILPLAPKTRVAVMGPSCRSLSYLSGGYTSTPSGASSDDSFFTYGETVFDAITRMTSSSNYVPEYTDAWFPNGTNDIPTALSVAQRADVTVICLGELPYYRKTGNIVDLALPTSQLDILRAFQQTNNKVIGVLIEGRPRLLMDTVSTMSGVLMAFFPGPSGGTAIADVLFGKCNPSGRLPITYPRSRSTGAVNYNCKVTQLYNPEWPFGFGLSYSTIVYDSLQVTYSAMSESFTVSVTVRNTSPLDANHTVLLFAAQPYRPKTPERSNLVAFNRIQNLQRNSVQTVVMSVPLRAFLYFDEENCETINIQSGIVWTVGVGGTEEVTTQFNQETFYRKGQCIASDADSTDVQWMFSQPTLVSDPNVIMLSLTSFALGFLAAWIIMTVARKSHIANLL